MNKIIAVALLAMIAVLFWEAARTAIDSRIDSENQMLCESAKVSGNKKWIHKCKPYYETGDIKLMRGVDPK